MRGAALVLVMTVGAQAQDRDAKVADLDRRLSDARALAQQLQRTIDGLAAELRAVREPVPVPPTVAVDVTGARSTGSPDVPNTATDSAEDGSAGFRERIVRTDLAQDERGAELGGAPELFIQSRFQAFPIQDATIDEAPTNFELTRMESRWSGRLSPKVGLGFELQYHPAPDGASFEIINDAFVEYVPLRPVDRTGRAVRQAVRVRHPAIQQRP